MSRFIELGSRVAVTDEAPKSEVYPFVTAGLEGVVTGIRFESEYPYQVVFEGDFAVDPHGCATIVRNPALLFKREELSLKEG